MNKLLFLILTLLPFFCFSQEEIRGKVLDLDTREPLAFVTLVFGKTNTGTSTDIDGNFSFTAAPNRNTIHLSYVGYQRKTISLEQIKNKKSTIYLKKTTANIDEVVILPGENPAHRIINNAIQNRKRNNPELATEFYYESYNKLTFNIEMDSNSTKKLDSITLKNITEAERLDSFPDSKVAYIMESVAERNHFPPDFSNEIVTESRMAGLKTPFFTLLGTQLQSFSLYENFVSLYGVNYLSPISTGSTSKYLFILEDTLYKGNDTSFIISFRPRKGKNFPALNGVISITTNLFAVENVIAQQADPTAFPVKIQQKYELINQKQWFPTQLNINILFRQSGSTPLTMIGVGKSYHRNIELKSKIERKDIGNVVLKTDNAIQEQQEPFWQTQRAIPLTVEEKTTYQFLDSIGEAENLDRLVFWTRGLLNGFVPIGKFNLALNQLFKSNKFENVRLGVGIETGEEISKSFRLGGYAGYGFKDEAWKYGAHIRWIPESENDLELKVAYVNDIVGIGGVQFANKTKSLVGQSAIQTFLNDQFDGVEKFGGIFSFRALRDFHFSFFGQQQIRAFNSNYFFTNEPNNNPILNQFTLSETGIDVRFSFREKFVEMLGVKLPIETKYPVVNFRYTKGFEDVLGGDFEYNRFDISISKSGLIKNLGTSSIQVNAGYIDNSLPLTTLYTMRGIFDPKVRVASAYSFETMFPNEFFADEYLNFFFRHNFGSLLFKSPKFQPQLLLISSFAIGNLQDKNQHAGLDFETLEHGYSESGIQLNNLYRIRYVYDGIYFGIGVGGYYRYGAYQNDEFKDNVAVKLTANLTM